MAQPKNSMIFFGTPAFALPSLKTLYQQGFNITAVVTQPDKPIGRGLKMEAPAVKKMAQELGLTVLQPPSLKDFATSLRDELRADLGIAVAYGKIIPKIIIDLFPHGILNLHPSLLPKYRGPSPIQTAILSGDQETGVTIMLLDEKMDQGPILAQRVISITQETGASLTPKLSELGAQLLAETLPKWFNHEITPQPQEHAQATYTKLLTRNDGHLDWNKPAQHLERFVRAYDPWPGTWAFWNNKRLKILQTALLHPTIGCASDPKPGYVWKTKNNQIAVNCVPGALVIDSLQLEGKPPLSALDFLHGYPDLINSMLL